MRLRLQKWDSQHGLRNSRIGNSPKKGRAYLTSTISDFALGRAYVHAPEDLSLKNKRLTLETVTFAKKIQVEAEYGKVFIDFSVTTDLSASALVYLAGQIQPLLEKYEAGRIIIGKKTGSKKARSILESSKFSDVIMGTRTNFHDDFVLVSGNGIPDPYIDDIMDGITNIYGGTLEPEHEQLIFAAISEALLNVNYHAYDDEEGIRKPWWLLTKVAEQKLYLALYDIGMGIPVSLPRRHFIDRLKQIVNLNFKSDASLIFGAMQASRTSTGEEKHGKGSVDIKGLVDKDGGCHLLIYSNRGMYQHKATDSDILEDLPCSVEGTLLQWIIPLGVK